MPKMSDAQLNREIDRRTRELLALQKERMRRIKQAQSTARSR